MSDIKLELNPSLEYDIVLEDDGLVLVEGDEAVAQNIRIRLQFFLGEHFLDTRQGIPYRRDIFVSNPDELLISQLLREAIETTAGVEEVTEFQLSIDKVTRKMSVTYRAQLSSGGELELNDFILDVDS